MAQSNSYMLHIAMDCFQSRPIPGTPGWDMEYVHDTGLGKPSECLTLHANNISPLLPIHIHLSTIDVTHIKETMIIISLTTIRH